MKGAKSYDNVISGFQNAWKAMQNLFYDGYSPYKNPDHSIYSIWKRIQGKKKPDLVRIRIRYA